METPETENSEEKKAPVDPWEPVQLKLIAPIEWGKQSIGELTIRPYGKAVRDLTLPMTPEGKIDYRPYDLAKVALRMAGHADGVIDKMHPKDISACAQVALSFFV